MYTEGEAYIVPWQLRGAVFYAHTKEEHRLFPSENSEALPNTTMPSSVDFLKSAKMFLKSFTRSANRVFRSKMENLFVF
jgi:hypothetical protein